QSVGAGGGAHVDVGAAGGALLRIVHGGVYAKLLNRLRRRRRQSLANRQIGRCRALNDFRGGAGGDGNASVVHNTCRSYLAGASAVEQITRIHSVQEKCVTSIALAVGPNGLIPQTGVCAAAVWQLCTHPRREDCQARETSGGQRA